MASDSEKAGLLISDVQPDTSSAESDKLIDLLKHAANLYHESLGVEKMKAEQGFELGRKKFEARSDEFNKMLQFEKQKFLYKFWALVAFISVFIALTFFVAWKSNDSDQRIMILTQAVMIALALIGGKGIASLFDKRTGGDR